VTFVPSSTTPTIAMRTLVLTLAFAVPLAFGVWQRLIDGLRDERPTRTASSGERLVLPTLLVPDDPNHRFLMTQPGSTRPVAFDPCRPIHYVVRPQGGSAAGVDLLPQAFANLSAATGLQFVDDGVTAEPPTVGRSNFLPQRYGDRWAPLLVAWSSPAEYPELSGPVIGVASSEPVDVEDDQFALVSGQVVLDTEQLTDVLRFNSGRAVAVATITHELGHVVGLGHVEDSRQLMYPSARPLVSTFGRGDLTGLAALGAGRCFDEL
jgi:hypothetical protein